MEIRNRFQTISKNGNQASKLPHPARVPCDLIGTSQAMSHVRQQTQALAPFDTIILLQGETGTGKELIARQIHHHSPRQNQPFVTLCCASLCESLLESELFGHEKGAFTGASCGHQGYFERADKGTLFLDEIGTASPGLQERLLRITQE